MINNDVPLKEIAFNKDKAEEYLNIYMDVHKRFVNCSHSDFKKMKKVTKKSRSKNHFNIWFKEKIPTAEENNCELNHNNNISASDTADTVSDIIDVAAEVASGGSSGIVGLGIKKVRGFYERLQRKGSSSDGDDVQYNKLPSKADDEVHTV